MSNKLRLSHRIRQQRWIRSIMFGLFRRHSGGIRASHFRIVKVICIVAAIYILCLIIPPNREWCQIYRHPDYHGNKKQLGSTKTNISEVTFTSKETPFSLKDLEQLPPGIHVDSFQFLLNPIMCKNFVYLVIIVPTNPDNFDSRQAIRQTWGSKFNKTPDLRLVFLAGLANDSTNGRLINEQKQYFDIVQASFEDTYRNLSLKSVVMLQWASQFCPQAKYLMKVDDDVFLQTDNLLSKLDLLQDEKRFILGYVGIDEIPCRLLSHKWSLKYSDYPYETLPPFVHGPSYVVSSDLVDDLYSAARRSLRIHLEDVHVTGLSAYTARASLIGRCGFTIQQRNLLEWFFSESAINSHEYSPDEIRDLWKLLQSWKKWIRVVKYVKRKVCAVFFIFC